MKNENDGSKMKYKLMKIGIFGLLGYVAIHYVLLFMFGVQYLDPDYYGTYFYSWRVNYADKMMTHGRYKKIKPNEHPDNKERRDFYEMAQSDESPLLLRFMHPEHFPREPPHHFSLNFPAYKSFLELRERFIAKSEGREDDLKMTYPEFKEKMAKEGGEDKNAFFGTYSGKSISNVVTSLFGKNTNDPWYSVSKILIKIVSNVMSGKEGYSFDGNTVGDGMMNDIREGAKALGLEEVINEERINTFFINNGRVSATPHETFAYSRMYYLFYFLTSGIDFESSSLLKMKENVNEFNEARMEYVANIFARIMASVYPNKHEKSINDAGLLEKIRSYYSPSMKIKDEEKKVVDENDYNMIKQEFMKASKAGSA